MILYTEHITNRLTYILDFFNKEMFDDPIVLCNSQSEYLAYEGPQINYSSTEIVSGEFFIQATPLLFETGIKPQRIDCFELNFHKAFFQTPGDFPFDLFAASFYLLTRYEEYLDHSKDEYGRFAHTGSLAWREGFLRLPLVNIWIQEFQQALKAKFPRQLFKRNSFRFLPTYDIDIAYSYLYKGRMRNLGGFLKDVFKGKLTRAGERLSVLNRKKKDPYDAYEWLDSLHLYCRMKAIYFFLLAREQKGFDKNISASSPGIEQLIQYHAAGYAVGIHPSWQSGDDPGLLREEKEWLENLSNRKIVHSRQHYLRLSIPVTYRLLIRNGIEKDFSMGYGSVNGFRSSVASSFFWYDLEQDAVTNLQLFPFCFMDANAYYEEKLSAAQASEELMHYYQVIRKVNGLMITIWHNHFLGSEPCFLPWKQVYEIFLKEEVYWDM